MISKDLLCQKYSNSELRLRNLYEYARFNKDTALESALGFITTDDIVDKNALTLSTYRLRQVVADIISKSAENINKLSQDFSDCFVEGLSEALGKEFIKHKSMVKLANNRKALFWRVSNS